MKNSKFSSMCFIVLLSVCILASAGSAKASDVNFPVKDKAIASLSEQERASMNIIEEGKKSNYYRGELEDKTKIDYYYRGYVDKKTGSKLYQIYAITNNPEEMNCDKAQFIIDDRLMKVTASRVESKHHCQGNNCLYKEDTVATLDRATLDRWTNSKTTIQLRFTSSKKSSYFDIDMNPEEISYFLGRMDEGK